VSDHSAEFRTGPDVMPAPEGARDEPEPEPAPEPDPLLRLGAAITEPDATAADTARTRLGDDVEAYGRLGELAVWWAGVRGTANAVRPSRVVLAGGGLDVAARRPGVRALAFPRGGSVNDAVTWALTEADRAADAGVDLVLLSLDRHAPWRSLAAALLALDPVEASGWPEERNLTDDQWMDEVSALRDRLRRLRGLQSEPVALLEALDSPVAAAAATLLVAVTARRTPVLLDGPGAAAMALLAVRTNHAAPLWWQTAHRGDDTLDERILGSLHLDPLTRLGIRVADGTASLAGLALLDTATGLLDTATRLPGAPGNTGDTGDPGDTGDTGEDYP
jgi:nicotinate-nucleotide--dimethylbenzimidazole phosphoribosyltransferase